MFSVIFCGTPDFAVPSLKALHSNPDFDIKLVITQPDKPVGRKKIITPPPVKVAAKELGLSVAQPENINNFILRGSACHPEVQVNEVDEPRRKSAAPQYDICQCDFLIVVAYGQLLKQPLLDLPRIAPVNVHASLLPRWRGASPIQHSILHGDTHTGVSVQRMVRQLDAGPILSQESVPIDERETAGSLHDKLAKTGAELLTTTLKKPLNETRQDESQVTVCGKLSRTDGRMDPSVQSALEIDRAIRALNPWPGVTMNIEGIDIKCLAAELDAQGDAFAISCANQSTLYLTTIQEPGKKPMTTAEWLRGRRQATGCRLDIK